MGRAWKIPIHLSDVAMRALTLSETTFGWVHMNTRTWNFPARTLPCCHDQCHSRHVSQVVMSWLTATHIKTSHNSKISWYLKKHPWCTQNKKKSLESSTCLEISSSYNSVKTHTNTISFSFLKMWRSKTWYLRVIKHCPVRVFQKIDVVLNALLVALWLVQAELQVLQTHFKLFLCLQINIGTLNFLGICTIKLTIGMNSVQSEHPAQDSLPFTGQGKHLLCACSVEDAAALCPFGSSQLQAPGFWSEGPLLWKQPGPLPCWPGQVEKNWITWQSVRHHFSKQTYLVQKIRNQLNRM